MPFLKLKHNEKKKMEVLELDESTKILDSCLAQINWRLKSSTKRRLQLGNTLLSLTYKISIYLIESIITLNLWCHRYYCPNYKNESSNYD